MVNENCPPPSVAPKSIRCSYVGCTSVAQVGHARGGPKGAPQHNQVCTAYVFYRPVAVGIRPRTDLHATSSVPVSETTENGELYIPDV